MKQAFKRVAVTTASIYLALFSATASAADPEPDVICQADAGGARLKCTGAVDTARTQVRVGIEASDAVSVQGRIDNGSGSAVEIKCDEPKIANRIVNVLCHFDSGQYAGPAKFFTKKKGAQAGQALDEHVLGADIKKVAAPPPPAPESRLTVDSDIGPLRRLDDATWRRALRELGLPLSGANPGNYYNRADDVAVLFFDADGIAYFPVPDIIDETDDIYVVVVDRRTRLHNLTIRTEGCKRAPVEERVSGEKARPTARELPTDIAFTIRTLGKCAGAASGGPKLTFTQKDGATQVQVIPINQVYRLAVGVAAAYDHTRQRDYELTRLPGETVPRLAQVHDRIGLTSLIHISFYPIARDYRKRDFLLAQRFQLFVGLDPRALDKHLVVGAGYELTAGLNLLLGWRVVTKQKILVEGSGLQEGDAFDGKSSSLPTRERWEGGGLFLGAGLSTSLLSRIQ